jgi:hypothetical protein
VKYQDLNTFVVPGNKYVVSFNWSDYTGAIPTEDLQNTTAAFLGLISNPVVRINGTFGGSIDLEFTAQFTTTLALIVQTVLSAWNELYPSTSMTYIQACDAPCGLVSESDCSINNIGACFSDVKSVGYIAIAILALIVVVKLT